MVKKRGELGRYEKSFLPNIGSVPIRGISVLDNKISGIIAETGVLATAYRHFGPNVMLGLGCNFGNVSDDLTVDDQGVFLNLVTQF